MSTWTERSFDLVSEVGKQVITLSTGIIALSVTFLTDVARQKPPGALLVLGSSWLAFMVALIFALALLMSLAGVQRDAGQDGAAPPSIDAPGLKLLGKLMVITFGLGVVLLLIAGLVLL